VLTIDGEPVPRGPFATWLVRMRGELMSDDHAALRTVERAAREELGLVLSPEVVRAEVDAAVAERVENSFGGDRAAWVRSLERLGRSERGYLVEREVQVRHELLADALTREGRVVPEELVVSQWERRHGPGGVTLEGALLYRRLVAPATPPGLDERGRRAVLAEAREALRLEVEALRTRVLEGESLAALSGTQGRDPRSAEGGRAVSPDRWPAEVYAEMGELEPGQVSAPLFARGGWWLFQLERVVLVPLEEARPALEEELLRRGPGPEEVQARVRALMQGVRIEVLDAMHALPPAGSMAREDSETLLRIGGRPVTRGEYGRWLMRMRGEVMAPRFVEALVVERAARERGIDVTPEEVRARVELDIALSIERDFMGEEKDWLVGVSRTGRSSDAWRREAAVRTRTNLLAEELLMADRVIDDRSVEREWLERYGAEGVRLDVRLIRLDTPREEGSRGAGLDATMRTGERAKALRARALAGEDFAALAREHSADERTAPAGGEVAGGLRVDAWPGYVLDAVRALEPGATSEALQIGSSWYLFLSLGATPVPLEEVREELRAELAERRPPPTEVSFFKNQLVGRRKVRSAPGMFE
jgi:hypothetical protein